MENVLAEWKKSVQIQMIRMDVDLGALAKAVGKSRSHTSAVIHGNVIAPDTASAVSDVLNIGNAPYAEVKQAVAEWGKAVRIALIQRNWKTRDLAEKTGKSRDYIAGMMNGYHINKTAAREISELLDVPEAPYSNW